MYCLNKYTKINTVEEVNSNKTLHGIKRDWITSTDEGEAGKFIGAEARKFEEIFSRDQRDIGMPHLTDICNNQKTVFFYFRCYSVMVIKQNNDKNKYSIFFH